jgi:hypothetical protein
LPVTRARDAPLRWPARTSTGLGDHGALTITAGEEHLLVVNAGSDDVSLFEIHDDRLELADVDPVRSAG